MKKSGLNSRGNLSSRKGLRSVNGLSSLSTLTPGSNHLKQKVINQKSSKQKSIDEEYSRIKKENFNAQELCTGCRQSYQSQPSHLVPRSWNRSLIAVIKNIKPHCPECHGKWESRAQAHTLLDYQDNMEAIKELDIEYYKILKSHETSK